MAEAEAMEKKAEAYQKYNKAAMAEMLIGVLPDIAGKIAEPLSQIDKITIIGSGEDKGVGVIIDGDGKESVLPPPSVPFIIRYKREGNCI